MAKVDWDSWTSGNVFVIAEAGVNHNGDLETALDMVDAAVACGADAVKFQTFDAGSITTPNAALVAYQKEGVRKGTTQREMLSNLQLSAEDHGELVKRCVNRDILFLSTAFDLPSLEFLLELGVPMVKVPSGEITNLPYLRRVASVELPVLLSTGMSSLVEVRDALDVITSEGNSYTDVIVMHCTSNYPTVPEDVNLRAMTTMAETLGVPVGYSDHTLGSQAAVAAVALGAVVLEKHFTLDRSLPGPDQKASATLNELRQYVQAVRSTRVLLGDGVKQPRPIELDTRSLVRKSIVASTRIAAGRIIAPEDITTKRPGTGLSPMKWDEVVGSISTRDYEPDEAIES